MSEQDALAHMAELRKEVRDIGPYVSEYMSRFEATLKSKAEASEVQRLLDDIEILHSSTSEPQQLLLGTKCLACDRATAGPSMTDQGAVSLVDKRQEEELWKDVQKAVLKSNRDEPADPLKYVAIHIGSPARMDRGDGKGFIEARTNADKIHSGSYLVKVGGASKVQSRPATGADAESSLRAPREPTPLYRVTSRRPGLRPLQPVQSPRIGTNGRNVPATTTIKDVLGTMNTSTQSFNQSVTTTAPQLSISSFAGSEGQWPSVSMQPAAHSGMSWMASDSRHLVHDSPEEDAAVIRGGPDY